MPQTPSTIPSPTHVAAAQVLNEANYLLILAGAGFSADSGLDTYENMAEEYRELCDPTKLIQEEARFQQFWLNFAAKYAVCDPHEGYGILDNWCAGGKLTNLKKYKAQQNEGSTTFNSDDDSRSSPWWVYTSNVDGHFRLYPSFQECVCEIHGNANEFRCASRMGVLDSSGEKRRGGLWDRWNDQVESTRTDKCDSDIAQVAVNDIVAARTDEQRNHRHKNSQRVICSHCGLPSRPNVLMFHDTDINVLGSINHHRDRYQSWEAQMEDSVVENGKNLVILEFGCGRNVPAVRLESEEVLRDCLQRIRANTSISGNGNSSIGNVTLIRVNPKDADIDDEDDRFLRENLLSIYDKSLNALQLIDLCLDELQKP